MQSEKNILKQIHQIYTKQIKHTRRQNKKIIVCFSGIPCTGKTHLAKILEKRYKAVRINSDQIRKIIKQLGKQNPKLLDEKYKEKILGKYQFWLLDNYPFQNKFILLDSGIDRTYDLVQQKSKEHDFKLFTIRIKASKKIAEKGIIKKLGKPDKNFIENIDRWVSEYKAFGKNHTSNCVIKNDTEKEMKTQELFAKLDNSLEYIAQA